MIIKSIYFLTIGIILSSCTLEKLQNKFSFPWENTNHPQHVLNLGKEHLQTRNYVEAKKSFNQVANSFPDSQEAKEARFYSLLIDFFNWNESSLEGKEFFSEKDIKYLPDGFCSDAKDILPDLIKQFNNLHKAFSKLKKENSKKDEELDKIARDYQKVKEEFEKNDIDYQKAKTELEQLRTNYRKMQEIEMKKEKMEKELRELSH